MRGAFRSSEKQALIALVLSAKRAKKSDDISVLCFAKKAPAVKYAVTRNPMTGGIVREYPEHNGAERRAILDASRTAQAHWARQSIAERASRLQRLGAALRERATPLAQLATTEMGKPLSQAIKEVEKCAAACDYYATHAASFLCDEVVTGSPVGVREMVAFRPLGTVLAIMPWNFPFWQVIRCAAPALAAGNAVILKHADNTTGCALALERAFAAAFPEKLFQVAIADHDALKTIITDDIVRAISLTGSERAGAAVAALAGQHLKKTVLELGGSDPYIVLADADVEAAAQICVDARLVNNGQSCVAAKRFIVDSAVYNDFREAFVAKCLAKKLGDPTHKDTDIGPLAKASIRDSVAKQVDATLAKGAQLILGGGHAEVPQDGYFYPVTVLDGVKPGMAAFDEEVFGPAAALICAKDEREALALANLSPYGLGGAIFSRDVERAEKLARDELDAGFVVVNGQVISDPRLPFGGIKLSGYGRELSVWGLREFVNVKTVVTNFSR